MSFDTEFDYTPAKNWLNSRINDLNGKITVVNDELNVIANLDAKYQTVANVKSTFLTNKKQCYQTSVNKVSNVVNEIIAVESISSDDKNVLYDFYTTYIVPTSETKKDFMRRMLCNTGVLIPDVTTLMNDGNITLDEGNCVASLICSNVMINRLSRALVNTL